MTDLKQLAEAVSGTIKTWVADRMKAMEAGLPDLVRKQLAELPKPKDGRDGKDGSDGLAGKDGAPGRDGLDGKDGERGERGEDGSVGKDGAPGRDGKDGSPGVAGKDGAPGERGEKGERGEIGPPGKDGAPGPAGKDGAAGINGKDGAPGLDGKDGAPGANGRDGAAGKDYDPTVLKAAVALTVREAVSAIPVPRDGKDADIETLKAIAAASAREAVAVIPIPQNGKDADQPAIVSQVFDLVMRAMPKPQDGKSVTVEDVKPLLEAEVQHWEHAFERRCQDVLERLAARYKGKDGADGFTVEDLDLSLQDDGRTIVVALKAAGGRVVRKELALVGMTQDREVFKSGAAYKRGDCVTYGGSYWCAKCDTEEPPKGPSNAWRLVMKGVGR